MVSMKLQFTWKTVLLPAVGLLAFFLNLYIFNVDIQKIIATVRGIEVSFYLLAIAAVMLETFFFALSWRSLLSFLSVKLSVVKSFLYIWFGIFIDLVIPAESISGEISRIYLVTREQNGATGKVVASLVTQRLIGMGLSVVSLFVGATALLMRHQLYGIVLNLTVFLAVSTLVFLVLLVLLCVKERWTLKIIDALIRFAEYVTRGRWKLTSVRKEVAKAAKAFHSAMKEFGRAPENLFAPAFFSVLSWIFSLAVAYLVFWSIGLPSIHWSVIIVTCSVVAAVKAVPLGVPFEVGLPEITMSTLYIILGVPPSMAATATILTRIITVWLRFFIGFAVHQWLGIKAITTK
ncbi:flippase-like domain-containing protein [Candidatus Bathyarchaeota archaeon]|nr:flippase-like domain-containing protein [Candidatus Bathyarchaeota archaeon]